MPQSNTGFWRSKLERNAARDTEHRARLEADGWKVFVIWECETKNDRRLTAKIRRFLDR